MSKAATIIKNIVIITMAVIAVVTIVTFSCSSKMRDGMVEFLNPFGEGQNSENPNSVDPDRKVNPGIEDSKGFTQEDAVEGEEKGGKIVVVVPPDSGIKDSETIRVEETRNGSVEVEVTLPEGIEGAEVDKVVIIEAVKAEPEKVERRTRVLDILSKHKKENSSGLAGASLNGDSLCSCSCN